MAIPTAPSTTPPSPDCLRYRKQSPHSAHHRVCIDHNSPAPQLTFAGKRAIDGIRRERFPTADNGAELVRIDGRECRVHMIGHHAPSMQLAALSIKVLERIADDRRYLWSAQNHAPMTRIKQRIDAFALLRAVEQLQAPNDDCRQAIGESEHDMLNQRICVEMRKIAAIVPAAPHARTMHGADAVAREDAGRRPAVPGQALASQPMAALTSRNSSRPNLPPSRPKPDCL